MLIGLVVLTCEVYFWICCVPRQKSGVSVFKMEEHHVARSSAEAECHVVANGVTKVCWL